MSTPNRAPAGRILLVAPGELWGGLEQCVLTLAEELAARGRLAGVVTLFDGVLAERLQQRGLLTEVIATGLAIHRSATSLGRVMATVDPALVHAHGYKATIVCGLSGRRPLVRTLHGAVEPGPMAEVLRLRAYEWLADRLAARRRAWTVFVSDDLRRGRGAGTARESRIHNGIVLDAPNDRSAQDAGEAPLRIGIVGRLTAVKGHDVALAAMAALPRGGVQLEIAGDGPDRQQLQTLAETLGVSAAVHFRGFVSDMRAFYRTLDVLIMPSRHEGVPYALLEAMGQGLPVLASRVGGIPEVVSDGHDGVLVQAGSSAALAEALTRLQDRPLRERLGAAARETVAARFSSTHMATQYLRLYDQLLEERDAD